MLSTSVVKQVLPLAHRLAAENQLLVVEPNSPLSQLCDTSVATQLGPVDSIEPVSLESISTSEIEAYVNNTDNLAHNEQFDALTEQLSQIVGQHISYTRNVVLDRVRTYIELVTQQTMALDPSPASQFKVVQVKVPVVLHHPMVDSEIQKYAQSHLIAPQMSTRYPTLGQDELLELIRFGNHDLDQLVQSWLAEVGIDQLQAVWTSYFADLTEGGVSRSMVDECLKPIDGRIHSILIYLLARGVKEKTPEGSRMGLSDLQECMDRYLGVACGALLEHQKRTEENQRRRTLILKRDEKNKTLWVFQPVYLDWVRSGGQNEVLFGLLVSKTLAAGVEEVTQQTESALEHWNRFISTSSAQHLNYLTNQYLRILKAVFLSMLKDTDEMEAVVMLNPNHQSEIEKRFADEFEMINTSELMQPRALEDVCMRLMTKARYYHTPAYGILSDIETFTQQQKDMDPKYAAWLATVNYVTDYVADQMLSVRM